MLKAEHVGRSESTAKRYEYDTCFGPEADQQEVYSETKALVQSAFDGYNVCVFAYGQVMLTSAVMEASHAALNGAPLKLCKQSLPTDTGLSLLRLQT